MAIDPDARGGAWEVIAQVVDLHRFQEESDDTQCQCGWDGETGTTFVTHVTDAIVTALVDAGYEILPRQA